MGKLITTEEVQAYFLKEGCTLLVEYKSIKTKMRFIARCGHEHLTSYDVLNVVRIDCAQIAYLKSLKLEQK